MKSAFGLDQQNESIDSKLVVALERVSEAFRVLLWQQSKEIALSPIQIQILLFVYFHARELCNVTYLANEFNVTKATMSDSIKVLVQKTYLEKISDPNDTRSFTLKLSKEGKKIVLESANFAQKIEKPLSQLPEDTKLSMLDGLFNLIYELNQSGVITVQRMCTLCSHYTNRKEKHYCNLLQRQLAAEQLRLDCPEFSSV
ncbi:transcriptional regulator, MarR family [Leptospira ryugenii]|uniref:Transcriptional regulator, MarR family n=1 Tax=Leptospira ryugenii TaxID=1917863 RepID=A0A2P2E257_9LEPT|nr:MarR family winged helix-turn-helix transcriptional regulator [Leptospira ryugenii]GBF50985.1 transcriptional regulator, MarR family [Leptospira ryugenii]